jgi:hypothetical protein
MDTPIYKKAISSIGCENCIANLVCGIQDFLILNAFDTQHGFKTKPRTIRGESQTDIRMYHSPRADFCLALLGRNVLECD